MAQSKACTRCVKGGALGRIIEGFYAQVPPVESVLGEVHPVGQPLGVELGVPDGEALGVRAVVAQHGLNLSRS